MPRTFTSRVAGTLLLAAFVGGASLQLAPHRVAAQVGRADSNTLIVDYKDDISHLDTALCYDTECFPFMRLMYDRLLDYNTKVGAGNDLMPDASVGMPTISNGGKTYTFKIRQDVYFWNGRQATSDDWKYSFERIINPKSQSGGAAFWFGIVGADAYKNGKAPHVSGIKTMGKFGLEIDLGAPDASFLNVLAMPFGSVLDQASVVKAGKTYDSAHPMGTGAYIFQQHTPNVKLVLTKNPKYTLPLVGHLQTIQADFGVNTDTSLLRVKANQADVDGDFPAPLPSAEFINVINDPVLSKRVVRQEQVAVEYLALNTLVKPFDNVLVRRAINMAINKKLIARLVNGRGSPTDNFLPPLMPGYKKFSLYAYNPDMAKKLLAQAGYPNGFSTTLWSDDTTDDPKVATSIAAQLKLIGINASLSIVNFSTFLAAVGTRQKTPISWNGWYQDFPDPDDFFTPILSCASAVPGTFNEPWYCNPKTDLLTAKLKATTDRAARLAQYSALDRAVMVDAPVVPVYNPVFYSLPSAALKTYYIRSPWTLCFNDYTK